MCLGPLPLNTRGTYASPCGAEVKVLATLSCLTLQPHGL